MFTSQSVTNIIPALISASKEFKDIIKNKKAFNYKYADLDEIHTKIKPALFNHGLFVTHTKDIENKELITYVYHVSGEYISVRSFIDFKTDNKLNIMQSFGSASTYAMRYNLIALFDLSADEDDDAKSSNEAKTSNDTKLMTEINDLIIQIKELNLGDEVKRHMGTIPSKWSDDHILWLKNRILDQKLTNIESKKTNQENRT